MKSVLSLDETPSALDRSFKPATKLRRELPTDIDVESILSSLVEDIHVKTREASQNTDLDMRQFLGIDDALQGIQGELLNNTSKLTEINKRIKRDTKKLEEAEDDRREYQKTGKIGNTITKSERSLNVSRKDQTNS